jgi:flagellar FliJ protein
MSKFKFELEPVKKVKENLELKVKREISVIEKQINEKLDEREALIQEIDSFRNYKLHKINAFEIQFIQNYKITLNVKIKNIENEILELQKIKENKINQLKIYSKEKKIIEKFEEIKKQEFVKQENKIEAKSFDELAIQKYLREKL